VETVSRAEISRGARATRQQQSNQQINNSKSTNRQIRHHLYDDVGTQIHRHGNDNNAVRIGNTASMVCVNQQGDKGANLQRYNSAHRHRGDESANRQRRNGGNLQQEQQHDRGDMQDQPTNTCILGNCNLCQVDLVAT